MAVSYAYNNYKTYNQNDPLALDGYVYQVNHFRGARDKRAWPIRMKRAVRFPFETLEFMKMD